MDKGGGEREVPEHLPEHAGGLPRFPSRCQASAGT